MGRILKLSSEECKDFESQIREGDLVTAIWNGDRNPHVAQARIIRATPKQWRVALTEEIDGFKLGQEIIIPRFSEMRYGKYLRILPDTLDPTDWDIRDFPENVRLRVEWLGTEKIIQIRQHAGNRTYLDYWFQDRPVQTTFVENHNITILGEYEENMGTTVEVNDTEVMLNMEFWRHIIEFTASPLLLIPHGNKPDLVEKLHSRFESLTNSFEHVLTHTCTEEKEQYAHFSRICVIADDVYQLHLTKGIYHAIIGYMYDQNDFLRYFQQLWRLLMPGGILLTPAPNTIPVAKKYQPLMKLIMTYNGLLKEDIPGFPEGTNLLRIIKPPDYPEQTWTIQSQAPVDILSLVKPAAPPAESAISDQEFEGALIGINLLKDKYDQLFDQALKKRKTVAFDIRAQTKQQGKKSKLVSTPAHRLAVLDRKVLQAKYGMKIMYQGHLLGDNHEIQIWKPIDLIDETKGLQEIFNFMKRGFNVILFATCSRSKPVTDYIIEQFKTFYPLTKTMSLEEFIIAHL